METPIGGDICVDCHNATVNPGADVFALTAGRAAFESAVPPTVRVLDEGYEPGAGVS